MKAEKTKKYILVMAITIPCIIALIYLFTFNQKDTRVENEKFFRVENILFPEQILWFKEELYILKDTKVFIFDVFKRELKYYGSIDEENLLGVYDDEIVYMRYKNKDILSKDEFATEISVLKNEEEIFFSEFHETVKPIFIKENKIYAIDNYLNSPNREYIIDMETKDIENTKIDNFKIDGLENIIVLDYDGNEILTIDKVNNISFFEVNEEKDSFAFVDAKGNIWIYLKNKN